MFEDNIFNDNDNIKNGIAGEIEREMVEDAVDALFDIFRDVNEIIDTLK